MKTRKLRLYNNPTWKPRVSGVKYATAKNARASIRKISKEDKSYRRLIAMRMYFRAKYHKNQTSGMREAMKVWKKYMDNLK
jgi:hypothetical protein